MKLKKNIKIDKKTEWIKKTHIKEWKKKDKKGQKTFYYKMKKKINLPLTLKNKIKLNFVLKYKIKKR
jgi:hypothetical protein